MSIICRLCLFDISNSFEPYSFESHDEKHLIEIVASFTPIKLNSTDNRFNLPTTCCTKCLDDVLEVQAFRNRIIKADQLLREKVDTKVDITFIECAQNCNSLQPKLGDHVDFPIKKELIKLEVEQGESSIISNEPIQIDPLLNDGALNEVKANQRKPEHNCPSNHTIKRTYKKRNLDEGPFECSICKKIFVTKQKLTCHVKRHREKHVKCEICGKLILKYNFARHKQIHNAPQQICDICGAIAKNSESLRGHIYYHHTCTAEQFKCDQCGKYFRYKYKLTAHLKRDHAGEKSKICEFCAKAFYAQMDLQRHINIKHLKMRPFSCEFCHKGFSSSSARRTHVRQHTNETPYKCEHCAEGFRQKVSLKTHLKSKHHIDKI